MKKSQYTQFVAILKISVVILISPETIKQPAE